MALERKALAEIAEVFSGNSIPKKKKEELFTEHNDGTPYVATKDVGTDHSINYDNGIFIPEAHSESFKLAPANSVLICAEGGSAGKKVAHNDRDIHFVNKLFCVYPDKGVLSKYLFYYFLSAEFKMDFNSQLTGLIGGVSLNKFKALHIPYTTLEEQYNLVEILDKAFDDIDRARALTEQNLKNSVELYESKLQQVFTRRGAGWVDEKLENLCSFSSGGTPSKKNSKYWDGDIPWISGRDMKATQLFDSHLHISKSAVEEASARIAPAGSILVLVRGMGLAHGAQIAELMVSSSFNQDIKCLQPKSNMVSRYLVFALCQRINSSDNVLSNAAHGTLKIDMDELKSVVVPVPPKDQQEDIVNELDFLIDEIGHIKSIYQRKLDSLDELKKSILQETFSGELSKLEKGAAA